VPVRGGRAELSPSVQLPVPTSGGARLPETVTVGIRPEGVDAVSGEAGRLTVRVTRVEHLGAEIFALVEPIGLSPGVTARAGKLVVRLDKRQAVQEGTELSLCLHLDEVLLFSPEGAALR